MGTPAGHIRPRLFGRGSWREVRRIGDILRTETVGGVLLIAAAVVALVWANLPWRETYHDLSSLRIGPSAGRRCTSCLWSSRLTLRRLTPNFSATCLAVVPDL
jgi:hypothetical protein